MLIPIHCGTGVCRDGAGVSGEDDHVLRAVRGGERDRHAGAVAGAGHHRAKRSRTWSTTTARARTASSPPRRSSKTPADGYSVLIATNTTHAANEHLYKKIPVPPGERLHARHRARARRAGHGGAPAGAGEDGEGIHRARQAPAGQAHLRRRQLVQPRRDPSCSSRWRACKLVHVPYKSNPMAVTDLVGGHIDMMITDVVTGLPQVEAGKVRALGVSSPKRLPNVPDLPTIAEAGVKGYELTFWFAAYLPGESAARRRRAAARAVHQRGQRARRRSPSSRPPASSRGTPRRPSSRSSRRRSRRSGRR